jgi:hypothetical protein
MAELIRVTVPPADERITAGYDQGRKAIIDLAAYRQCTHQPSHSTWRRVVERIDLAGRDGYTFQGPTVQPNVEAHLRPGTLVVTLDRYFAKANWYANDWRKGVDADVVTRLYEVADDGSLVQVCASSKWSSAQELLGWLVTNSLLPTFTEQRVGGRRTDDRTRGGPLA